MNQKLSSKAIQGGLWMGALLLSAAAASADTQLTFTVDMSVQITNGTFNPPPGGTDTVTASGTFNGWGQLALTQSGGNSNVYVGGYDDTLDANGATMSYKFVDTHTGYESTADFNNRAITLPATSGATLNLPYIYFNDAGPAITNEITFQVDMSMQIYLGNWNSNSDTIGVVGNSMGWGTPVLMTNNPSILRTNGQGTVTSNVYQATFAVTNNCTNAAEEYKYFVPQYGAPYESVSIVNQDAGGNRWFINSSNQTLPIVFLGDQPFIPVDYVTVTNCMVTFTVQMTNAIGTNITGSVTNIVTFDNSTNSSDTVWINGLQNGDNGSFWTWASPPIPGGPAAYQMTQISNTTLFTITLPVLLNQYADLEYKYSLDGYDNEAGFNLNHNRWIRSMPDYTMPVDTFGSQGASDSVEVSFGNLAITNLGNNQVSVSWLGRDGVELQTSSSLSPAVWTSQPLTDGTNLTVGPGGEASTNYTIGLGNLFYRLTGP
jgi:hypothetical protein